MAPVVLIVGELRIGDLEAQGYELLHARSAEEVLSIVKSRPHAIRAVIMDRRIVAEVSDLKLQQYDSGIRLLVAEHSAHAELLLKQIQPAERGKGAGAN